jgi:hypothetical protein
MSLTDVNKRKMPMNERYEFVLNRSRNRQKFLELLIKLMGVCELTGKRLVVENPWAMQTYLKNGFIKAPQVIDNDRTRRGDYFVKPTAFWFVSCEPTNGFTYQPTDMSKVKNVRDARGSKQAGICSEERSMISSDYARNWICDFILGQKQDIGQLSLF